MSSDKDKEIAEHFVSLKDCGTLHLEWMMDEYWKSITNNYIFPAHNLIHKTLMERKITEDNPAILGDADGKAWYIPCDDKKVWVMTNQTLDYLFISHNDYDEQLHIRRIFRPWKSNRYYSSKDLIKNIKTALSKVEELSEFSDDHYKYSRRPSLDFYKSINFEMDYAKNHKIFGDGRDGGYVLSSYKTPGYHRLENTLWGDAYRDLKVLSDCYIGCVMHDLDIMDEFVAANK